MPAAGLVVQSSWVALLCLTGSYNQLLNYVIFAALVFYALTTIGLFILRAKRPDIERPYRTIGYPVLPALYIALTTAVMLLILMSPSSRQDAFFGLAIVVLGVPVYFLWRAVDREA
ncbi:MAG TPA: amino acid permease [Gemmatimonadaceae bacterium]|nr:amino acid permease [Gemmatimonadaceae bacterium]